MLKLNEVAANLNARGYRTAVCEAKEVTGIVLKELEGLGSVGWGGSESIKELGLREAIGATGIEIRDHRTDCDVFMLSANALLEDGRIVNIDGTGNRIAASIFGPKKVIYIIGCNKIVEGGFEDAVRRVRTFACPPNCRRLGKKTPCAAGRCPSLAGETLGAGCDSPDRICKVTAVFERPPTRTPTLVILVNQALGY